MKEYGIFVSSRTKGKPLIYTAVPLKESCISPRKCSMTPWNCLLNKHVFVAESTALFELVFFNKHLHFKGSCYSSRIVRSHPLQRINNKAFPSWKEQIRPPPPPPENETWAPPIPSKTKTKKKQQIKMENWKKNNSQRVLAGTPFKHVYFFFLEGGIISYFLREALSFIFWQGESQKGRSIRVHEPIK